MTDPDSAPACPLTAASLADPAVQRCPDPYYAALHAESPVHYDPRMDLWLVTRHADLVEAALKWEVFSSEIDMRRDVSNVDPTEADELFRREGWFVQDVLSQVDPPRHTTFRKLVERLFTGPAVRRMHAYLDAHVIELIEAFGHRGSVDFLEEFAIPLPLDVIADQLGLPRGDGRRMKDWSDAFIESFNPTISAERKLACVRRILEFQKYFAGKREEKLAAPADDLITMMATTLKDDGQLLTIEEYLAVCAQLMVAGNETTRHHLLAGMLMLADDPALQARLRGEPALVPRFVEESLRLESPAQGLYRRCTRDYELGGVKIPAGAKLLLMYGAANRDAAAFADPGRLDLERPNLNRHVAFGHGIHSCIGRTLATAELTFAFTRLLERLHDIRLDPAHPRPEAKPHFNMRGLDSMRLVFSQRASEQRAG